MQWHEPSSLLSMERYRFNSREQHLKNVGGVPGFLIKKDEVIVLFKARIGPCYGSISPFLKSKKSIRRSSYEKVLGDQILPLLEKKTTIFFK